MALAYRTSAAGGNTTSGTSPSATLTPAVGDLFLVFCQATGNANATPTCSDGNTGGAYTLLWTAASNSSANRLSCFVRNALLVNTTSTVVTVACGAHTAAEVAVVAISGGSVAGAAAIAQTATQTNQAGATVPAPSFAASANYSNLILSVVGNITNPAGVAATTGSSPTWTIRQNVGQTACGLGVETANQFTAQTVTWGGNSATAFASGLVEVTIPPNTGVDVSKLVAYLLPGVPPGVDVSKLVAYAVLDVANTNPPVWPVFSMPSGTVGSSYLASWDLSPAASPTTYTVVSGSIPSGLTLNNVTADQGSITGTPTVAGTYPFTLRATNTYGTADKPFTITISAPSGGGGSFTYAG